MAIGKRGNARMPSFASGRQNSRFEKHEKERSDKVGFFGRVYALFRLVRFEHALMFSFSVLIAEIIALGRIPEFGLTLALSLLVPIFSEMGAFAMNDLLDVESDRINQKKGRPLVSGELSQGFALSFTIMSFGLALVFAYFISWPIFLLTAGLVLLAALYNLILKDLPLVGNIYIAFTMGIPFIFGNFVVGPGLVPTNILIAVMGFLAGVAREIVKTSEDVEGDKKARKSKTLPILIGVKYALWLAGIIYAVFVLVSLLPYHLYLKIGTGFMIVLVADAIFSYSALMLIFSRRRMSFLKTATKLSLVGLSLGLIGLLVSVLGY